MFALLISHPFELHLRLSCTRFRMDWFNLLSHYQWLFQIHFPHLCMATFIPISHANARHPRSHEGAAVRDTAARSHCSLDQLRVLRRRLSSSFPLSSPPEVEKSTWLNNPKERWGLTWALGSLDPDERPKFVKALGVLGLPLDFFGLGLEMELKACGLSF